MITKAQHNHYFALWGDARRELRRLGLTPKEADAKRKLVHLEAGAIDANGDPKSHYDLTNDEFDDVKAKFLAISRPADLNAQIHQIDQAIIRARHKAGELMTQIGVEQSAQARYLDGVAKNVHGKPADQVKKEEWPDVLGALNRTRIYKQKSQTPAVPAGVEDTGDPF
jgi:hypothetical protein